MRQEWLLLDNSHSVSEELILLQYFTNVPWYIADWRGGSNCYIQGTKSCRRYLWHEAEASTAINGETCEARNRSQSCHSALSTTQDSGTPTTTRYPETAQVAFLTSSNTREGIVWGLQCRKKVMPVPGIYLQYTHLNRSWYRWPLFHNILFNYFIFRKVVSYSE